MTSPQRIVSLISSGTGILFGLGLGGRVVGVSHECDFPPQALQLPRVTATPGRLARRLEVLCERGFDGLAHALERLSTKR